jgi:hypothetical protein
MALVPLIPHKFLPLRCWYYWWQANVKYEGVVAFKGMMFTPHFTERIVVFTSLHASRPRKDRAALSPQYSVASFATLRVLSCLHSPGLRCSCCNVVQFFCDLEVCNLVTATVTDSNVISWNTYSVTWAYHLSLLYTSDADRRWCVLTYNLNSAGIVIIV